MRDAWQRADPGGRPNEVLLVLDFEKNGHYPGGTMRVGQAIQFIERIRQRTGKYPGLYSNEYRIRDVLNRPAYAGAEARAAELLALGRELSLSAAPGRAVEHWDMWQYTGDGVCDLAALDAIRKTSRTSRTRSAICSAGARVARRPSGEAARLAAGVNVVSAERALLSARARGCGFRVQNLAHFPAEALLRERLLQDVQTGLEHALVADVVLGITGDEEDLHVRFDRAKSRAPVPGRACPA